MLTQDGVTTAEVIERFTSQVEAHGGTEVQAYSDDTRGFARGLLPQHGEVTLGDGFQAGVAMRIAPTALLVAPYIRRSVCKNGQILGRAVGVRIVEDLAQSTRADVVAVIDEGVALGGAPTVFQLHLRDFRRLAVDPRIDQALLVFSRYGLEGGIDLFRFGTSLLDAIDLQDAMQRRGEGAQAAVRKLRAQMRARRIAEARQGGPQSPREREHLRRAWAHAHRRMTARAEHPNPWADEDDRAEILQRAAQNLLEAFRREGGRTRYDVLNAITAVARESRDPQTRWVLEELAGRYALLITPVPETSRGLTFDAPASGRRARDHGLRV